MEGVTAENIYMELSEDSWNGDIARKTREGICLNKAYSSTYP